MSEGFNFGQFPSTMGGGSGGAGFVDLRSQGGMTGRAGVPYPSPFFDAAHTYLPKSIKSLFQWCRYYFLTNPLVNAVCYKMAAYPITELTFESEHRSVVDKYTYVKDHVVRFKQFLVEGGLDYQCFGNGFFSIAYPFIKFLKCKKCGASEPARSLRQNYRWRDMKFLLTCPKCKHTADAKEVDVYQKNALGIRLIRWDPERITVDYVEEASTPRYYYRMSARTRSQIVLGKSHLVEDLPTAFLEAARKKMALVFGDGQLFHMKRPTIAGKDQGWGMPRILPVLKDAFYLQVLKKGQESIAREHIVPLRVLFPQPGSGSSDPYTSIPLEKWRAKIEEEVSRWRRDPNYIPVMPLPVGHQVIGGQGRAMVLHQEHRVWAEHIVAGMHVPQEFIFGGMSYTGTNVSMRQLENEFINYRDDVMALTDWVFDRIGSYMGWPKVRKKFRRFRMADDLQRVMIYFQANQAGKISDRTFLRELGEDLDAETELKNSEKRLLAQDQRRMQVAAAAAQAEAQQVMGRYMQAGQNDMIGSTPPAGALPDPNAQQGGAGAVQGPAGATMYPENAGQTPTDGIPPEAQSQVAESTAPGNMNVLYMAKRVAAQLDKLLQEEPEQAYAYMNQMRGKSPQFYALVSQIMQSKTETRDPLNAMQSPLPEQKPPRRGPDKALV